MHRTDLFNVDDLAGFGCSDHQVGLPAQKSRYLKHVNILGNNAALFLFMNVGNNRYVIVEFLISSKVSIPSSRPTPRAPLMEVRLALSKEALKI